MFKTFKQKGNKSKSFTYTVMQQCKKKKKKKCPKINNNTANAPYHDMSVNMAT